MNAEDVGQLILMGIPGTDIDNETANIIRKVKPGGIILFGRNIFRLNYYLQSFYILPVFHEKLP